MNNRKVRVRFAPSPTGPLHIGGVRTCLYNYLFAKKNGGELIFRIEDTDSNRFVEGAEQYIIDSLTWLGIKFDEGVSFGGNYGPYRQSERRDIYRKYVKQLLYSGHAYIAFDTAQELDNKRNEIKNFQYDASTRLTMCNSLTLSEQEVKERIERGEKYVVRVKIEPNEEVVVHDIIRGDVHVNSSILDDKVLYKSADDLPTYHLANIVDDHLMEVSHVIRGEEWLPSAPLHVLLYQYFGWADTMPQFAHLSLLLKPDGNGKLSKRDGDRLGFPVFPMDWYDPVTGDKSSGYKQAGYMPEAVINFLALLGWNPGNDEEILSMEQLIELFSLEHCSKSGAKFDFEKGKWFNRHYINSVDNKLVAQWLAKDIEAQGIETPFEKVELVTSFMRSRVNLLKELWPLCSFFWIAPTTYDQKAVEKRWKAETPAQMVELREQLAKWEDWNDYKAQEEAIKLWCEQKGYGLGNIMNPFRLMLVGELKGPGMFEVTTVLGKEETLARIDRALEVLPK